MICGCPGMHLQCFLVATAKNIETTILEHLESDAKSWNLGKYWKHSSRSACKGDKKGQKRQLFEMKEIFQFDLMQILKDEYLVQFFSLEQKNGFEQRVMRKVQKRAKVEE